VSINPYTCGHESSELRRKINRGGAEMFGRQCVICGRINGKWVKRADIADTGSLASWDVELEERSLTAWAQEERDRRASEAYSRSTRWWQTYNAFLSSSYWKTMRSRVMARAGNVCEACLVSPATQVHHTRYPKRPPALEGIEWTAPTMQDFVDQPLYELRAICHACHALQHQHMREEAA